MISQIWSVCKDVNVQTLENFAVIGYHCLPRSICLKTKVHYTCSLYLQMPAMESDKLEPCIQQEDLNTSSTEQTNMDSILTQLPD